MNYESTAANTDASSNECLIDYIDEPDSKL